MYKFIFFLLAITTNQVYPFASWLVERRVACYLNLRDPTEVIMGFEIVPYSNMSRKDVLLRVWNTETGEEIKLQNIDGGKHDIIYVSSANGEMKAPKESFNVEYTIQLIVPPDLNDLQYVMDIDNLPLSDSEDGERETHDQAIEAEFTSASRGCQNKRAHGKKGDNGLGINIVVRPLILSQSSNPDEFAVNVVSGWALGYEAVKLTHSITFLPDPNIISDAKSNKIIHQISSNIKEKSLQKEPSPSQNFEDFSGEKFVGQENLASKNSTKSDRGMYLTVTQFRKKYEKDTFGWGLFSLESYFSGLFFMIFSGIGVIRLTLYLNFYGWKRKYKK